MAEDKREDELLALTQAGYSMAGVKLARLLAGQEREEELRQLALEEFDRRRSHSSNTKMTEALVDYLVGHNRIDDAIMVLQPWANSTFSGKRMLAGLLAEHGREEELRRLADSGYSYASLQLAQLLVKSGRWTEGIDVLRAVVRAEGSYRRELAEALAEQGIIQEAIDTLQPNPGWLDEYQLIDILTKHRREVELRQLVDSGNSHAALPLAELLTGGGRDEEAIAVVQRFLDEPDHRLRNKWAELLIKHGREAELRALADRNYLYAETTIPMLLEENGLKSQANLLRRFGLTPDDWIASDDTNLSVRRSFGVQGIMHRRSDGGMVDSQPRSSRLWMFAQLSVR
jgi:hypothetical protein